jgi:small-conductance mechanosensitive channel
MTFEIDFNQPSTIRGIIWLVGGALGTLGYFSGFDPMPIMTLAGAVAGGLGVAIKDSK